MIASIKIHKAGLVEAVKLLVRNCFQDFQERVPSSWRMLQEHSTRKAYLKNIEARLSGSRSCLKLRLCRRAWARFFCHAGETGLTRSVALTDCRSNSADSDSHGGARRCAAVVLHAGERDFGREGKALLRLWAYGGRSLASVREHGTHTRVSLGKTS